MSSKYTSTPKRRRINNSGIILRSAFRNLKRSRLDESIKEDSINNYTFQKTDETAECEFLPCNQIEYLSDSGNNSSACSDIPGSPEGLNYSVLRNIDNWKSLRIKEDNHDKKTYTGTQLEIEDISDDMFQSRLDQEVLNNHKNTVILQNFKEEIEQSFDLMNQSISALNEVVKDNSLFETKDSFLLDIQEADLILQNKENTKTPPKPKTIVNTKNNLNDINSFYGMPNNTKGLFKSYRKIDKLYDWQEECLSLDAIKERRNLIYALPTSGGKTLVAEVLMLREVLCHKRNTLFILPFVAIVQEKIWSLSPFAVQLDFLVEEYAGGKGHIPPKKRRKKNSIYVATIEKGLALVRSLIQLDRLNEIGLIVVDELHLIGEQGRGGTLETLLTTIMFANKGIQIVGMSATIGNLPSLASFLRAEVFQREFRPVELTEYVKLGDMLYRIQWHEAGVEVVPEKSNSESGISVGAGSAVGGVAGLVEGVWPASVLVFCATKRNCENVAAALCRAATKEMLSHRAEERRALSLALQSEGGSGGDVGPGGATVGPGGATVGPGGATVGPGGATVGPGGATVGPGGATVGPGGATVGPGGATTGLAATVLAGVAYHHAGLAADERALLEHAYRSSVISVVCCTSTLAAGVNLPARRVIIRAPRQGRQFITLAQYKQMVGRAGRAGVCDTGDSIIICENPGEWQQLRGVLSSGLPGVQSQLSASSGGLLMSAVALKLATTTTKLLALLDHTLLAHQDNSSMKDVCNDAIRNLIQTGAIEPVHKNAHIRDNEEHIHIGNMYVYNDTELQVSALGNAAIQGCMELSTAKQLLRDLEVASRGIVLQGSLHLLFLVTPHDAAGVKPDYRHYYSLYCNLDDEGVQTAKTLGITEMNAIRMMTGKAITNVSEQVLCRFYLALALRDLWRRAPLHYVADKYLLPRGTVQSLMTSSASFASSAHKLCSASERLWMFAAMFGELAPRLQHCAAPGIEQLMDLPNVKKARALQLVRAGYKTVESLARASPELLSTDIPHLHRDQATHLISAARMMLIEKVENLRAEAEDVMLELNM